MPLNRRWGRTRVLVAAVVLAPVLASCGSSGGGGNTVNWYVFKEPGGAYDQAVANCNKQAGGQYRLRIIPLPTSADQQRELLVRRLAAKDSSVDVLGMDVIWTGEFAEAGWIKPFSATDASEISNGALQGPLLSGTYKNRMYAAPFTSNTQLLWYRKDRVPTPPQTWDDVINSAIKLHDETHQPNYVEVQANRYEGYTVWFNALLNSAGGSVLSPSSASGRPQVSLQQGPTVAALDVIQKLAHSPVADPSISAATEDTTRLAFESGKATFMTNYPFVYPSAQKDAPDVFKNMAWVRFPTVKAGEPSRPPLGGINLGVGTASKHPALATAAVRCLISDDNQAIAAIKGGLPPTRTAVYDRPEFQSKYPFGGLIRESLQDAAPRPVAAAYNDISLAIQRTLHPPSGVNPPATATKLRDLIAKAIKGKALL